MAPASPYCPNCGAANQSAAAFCFACGHALTSLDSQPASAGALPLQHVLRGRYRLVGLVGQGGFGAVYRAEDTQLGDRQVAVKEMSQHGLSAAELTEATEAFHREALLLAGLTHPNLPRIYEQFEEGGHWYLVMDFIAGETLESRLARVPGNRLSLDEALQLGLQLATVLGYLHSRQPPIIFRDLKPANVMLTPDGQLYLIDFGIARLFKPGQTRDTVAFGSAGYAAPEQYGKAQTTVQSDIYSLGATLHQLLSGDDPSNSPFVFAPLNLAELPELEQLITQMLETRQEKRPTSVALIKQELQRLANELAARPSRPRPQAAAPPLQRPPAPAAPPAAAPARAAPVAQKSPQPGPSVSDLVRIYRGHTDAVKSAVWSPDGKLIASAGCDETVHVWEALTGKRINACLGHRSQVNAVAWSPDGKYIASGGADHTVRVWDVTTGTELLVYRYKGWAVHVLSVAWSPGGARIASGANDGIVQVWDATSGQNLATWHMHTDLVKGVAWSPDGQYLVAGGGDNIQLWLASGDLLYQYDSHSGGINSLAWSPGSVHFASGGDDTSARLWRINTNDEVFVFRRHSQPVLSVAWSPDGTRIASGGADWTVQVWKPSDEVNAFAHREHRGIVQSVAWSPDGKYIASGGDDQTVQVWRAKKPAFL